MNKKYQQSGLFITREKYVKAIQLQQYEQYVDFNGEEFAGIPGDWKIWDQDGYVYYMNKHQFEYRFRPFTEQSFNMYHNRKKINSLNLFKQNL